MGEVAKELVVKISHLQQKGELGPLADLVSSLAEHSFTPDELITSGLSKLGACARARSAGTHLVAPPSTVRRDCDWPARVP